MTNEQENIQDENLETSTATAQEETVAQELTLEERLTLELADAKDKYARLFAEFDNYKKRTSRERVELIQSASKGLLSKLLPVLDDLDRALQATQVAQDVEPIKLGMELVSQKFIKVLEQEGLKQMDNLVGQTFDAEFQEAITAIPAPTEKMKNKVIDVVEKGYFINDKVIRFAKVVIGQ